MKVELIESVDEFIAATKLFRAVAWYERHRQRVAGGSEGDRSTRYRWGSAAT